MARLLDYKELLENGTHTGQNYEFLGRTPLGRYHTLKYAFDKFRENKEKVIVELGTIRSYVHGGLPGCNTDNPSLWDKNCPENWDWGAGCFSRIAAEELKDCDIEIHTVDLIASHINRCKIITQDLKEVFNYHISCSLDFLKNFSKRIGLLYIDTGDMTPIDHTANHQYQEALIIVSRNLVSDKGIIVIDDVANTTPLKFGEKSKYGKAKLSLPYFEQNGFKKVMDEYQIILERT